MIRLQPDRRCSINQTTPAAHLHYDAQLVRILSGYAIIGCIIFAVSIVVADFVVPDHDWIADTISDLGAGKYEYIVDIGIYAFSAAIMAIAVLAAHLHLGGWGWNSGIIGLVILALIVFLIGARNEYGDSDNDGTVIHIYLVYALGALLTVIPLCMASATRYLTKPYRIALIVIAIWWAISAPVFFFLPTGFDGIYERYLGLIAFTLIFVCARMLSRYGQKFE